MHAEAFCECVVFLSPLCLKFASRIPRMSSQASTESPDKVPLAPSSFRHSSTKTSLPTKLPQPYGGIRRNDAGQKKNTRAIIVVIPHAGEGRRWCWCAATGGVSNTTKFEEAQPAKLWERRACGKQRKASFCLNGSFTEGSCGDLNRDFVSAGQRG